MKSELVSVCIPTYNGASYLRKTLESILGQTYRNIEIIINDDGSTDQTENIVKEFADNRIHYFKNEENLGLAANWNQAVFHATGTYIKLVCQDDILFPDAIEAQIRAIESDKEIVLVLGNSYVIDEEGNTLMKRKRFHKNKTVDGKKYARKSFCGRNIYSEPANILYKKIHFDALKGYDPSLVYTPDWDFALRLSYLGKVCGLKKNIMKFRVTNHTETSRLYREQGFKLIEDSEKLLRKHVQLGEIKLGNCKQLYFKIMIRLYHIMRMFVLLLKK